MADNHDEQCALEDLLQSGVWQYKICGLQPSVTHRLRDQLRDPPGLAATARRLLLSVQRLLAAGPLRVLVGVSRARGSPLCLVSTEQAGTEPQLLRNGGFHVVVFCVIDPLDIDSKQVTLLPVRSADDAPSYDEVYSRLYRKELLDVE